MKIATSLIFAVLLAGAFISCKKNHTCTCTEHYEGADSSWTQMYGDTIFKASEKKAEDLCNGLDGEPQTILTETYWLDCELK